MAEWLKRLAALAEDPGPIPSIHRAADGCLQLQIPSPALHARTSGTHTYMAKHSYV